MQNKSKIHSAEAADRFFIKIGPSFDESFFGGAIFQLGHPFLYGTLSYNSNNDVYQVGFGAAASLKLVRRIRLHLTSSVGELKKSSSFSDSAGYIFPIATTGKLVRAGLLAEFPVSKRMKLQVGAQFNSLNTKYFMQTSPTSLSMFRGDGDQTFYTLKPPYLLSNTYSRFSNSNLKTWLGFQLNLLYYINLGSGAIKKRS